MILAIGSLGSAFAMWRERNQPVNPDSIPVMFVVVARGADGKYVPAVLYEWSSYVQSIYRPPIYHKTRETPDFDPHWAGMMIVSDDEKSHYDFRVPVADVVQVENDLNNLPAAFGSNATYRLDVHDSENGCATELTLYRSTNGSNVFRYRINDGSVTPLRFGGTGRFTSMV